MAEGGGGGVLREVLAVLGIEVEGKELEEADKKIEGFVGKLKALGSVVAEAFAFDEVKEFVEHQVEAATELERTAVRLGLTTEKLQEYQLAAGLAGVRTESLTVGMRYLERSIAEAGAKGQASGQLFAQLGIKLKEGGKTRETSDVLEDLADKFSKIQEPAKRTQIAMELFGRQGAALIPLLAKGREGFAEARKEMEALGGPTTEQTIEGAKRVEEAQVRLNFVMSRLKETIAIGLFPVFEKLIVWATEVVKHVKEFTKDTYILQTAFDALAVVAGFKALTSLQGLLKTFGLLKPSILETVAALLEFAAPAIIVFALFVVFDDLFTLWKGGTSVIGTLIDAVFGLGSAATMVLYLNAFFEDTVRVVEDLAAIVSGALIPVFVSLWEIVKGLVKVMVDLESLNFSGAAKDMADAGKSIGDSWRAGIGEIKNAFKDLGSGSAPLKGQVLHSLLAGGADPRALLEEANSPGKATVGPITYGPQPQQGQVKVGAISFGGPPPVHHTTVHQQVNTKVDVHTASDDPHPIGDAVGQGVATQAERATSNALGAVKKT